MRAVTWKSLSGPQLIGAPPEAGTEPLNCSMQPVIRHETPNAGMTQWVIMKASLCWPVPGAGFLGQASDTCCFLCSSSRTQFTSQHLRETSLDEPPHRLKIIMCVGVRGGNCVAEDSFVE